MRLLMPKHLNPSWNQKFLDYEIETRNKNLRSDADIF